MKKPGVLVKTNSGNGRTYSNEKQINKKIVVHLIDENFQAVKDEKGIPKKILCDPKTLQVIGFID